MEECCKEGCDSDDCIDKCLAEQWCEELTCKERCPFECFREEAQNQVCFDNCIQRCDDADPTVDPIDPIDPGWYNLA